MTHNFVVDNSVVMAWCFEDEAGPFADNILDRLQTSMAFVPSIWPLEVGNVLLVAERKKRLGEADRIRFVSLLLELPIHIDQEPPERMFSEILALARKHHLSSYDASYLDLAMRKGLPLATLDASLKAAADRCNVRML